jgi:hypothetical protein
MHKKINYKYSCFLPGVFANIKLLAQLPTCYFFKKGKKMKSYLKITLVIALLTCLTGKASEACENILEELDKAKQNLYGRRHGDHGCAFPIENESQERKNYCYEVRSNVNKIIAKLKANKCPLFKKSWNNPIFIQEKKY